MKTTNFKCSASLFVLIFFLAACGGAPEKNTQTPGDTYGEPERSSSNAYNNIFEDVNNSEQYDVAALVGMETNTSTFAELLEQSGISLEIIKPVTLFVPTNQAFEEMPEGHIEHLRDPQNRVDLVRFINRHVLPSKVPIEQFNETQAIETPMDEEINITVAMNGQVVNVGGAEIIKSNIMASDGIVHVVDDIVRPTRDIIRY